MLLVYDHVTEMLQRNVYITVKDYTDKGSRERRYSQKE